MSHKGYKKITFLYLLISVINCKSQNLIENGSFEIDNLSSELIFNEEKKFTAANWKPLPHDGADVYGPNRKFGHKDTKNYFGSQIAYDGERYAGISSYEYLLTKLNKPLVANKYYCFRLFISLADFSTGTFNEIDFTLNLNEDFTRSSYNIIYCDKLIKSKNNWIELTSVFKAKGMEQYLTIGLINKSAKYISTQNINGSYKAVYYYLDNISLAEVADSTGCIPHETNKPSSSFDLAIGKPFSLKNINFNSNSSQLIKSSYPELNNLADYLKKNPIYTLEILGHRDNSGNESENKALSNGRAKSVYEFLVSKGISDKRITYKGYGSSKPLKPNTTEENKLINRRVEIILKK